MGSTPASFELSKPGFRPERVVAGRQSGATLGVQPAHGGPAAVQNAGDDTGTGDQPVWALLDPWKGSTGGCVRNGMTGCLPGTHRGLFLEQGPAEGGSGCGCGSMAGPEGAARAARSARGGVLHRRQSNPLGQHLKTRHGPVRKPLRHFLTASAFHLASNQCLPSIPDAGPAAGLAELSTGQALPITG